VETPVPAAPFSDAFLADPHPTYARLRDVAPAARATLPNGIEVWLVTRYDDVRRGLADPRLRNDRSSALPELRPFGAVAEADAPATTTMLDQDPPVHTRLRRLVSPAFTPAAIEAFRPRLELIAGGLLDRLAGRDTFDVVEDFAVPFIWQATAELLGVDVGERARFRRWSTEIALKLLGRDDDQLDRPVRELHALVRELVETKRARPGNDLFSKLVRGRDEGELTETELVAMAQLLLVAGQEGPANSIATGIFLLLSQPDVRAELQRNPGLLPGAVEEILRLEAPLGLSVIRWATEPVTFSGVMIPAGEPIMFSLLSTGRDPRRFVCPDRLDPGRDEGHHLAFGWGAHFCLGAALGRAEVQTAIAALLDRFPALEFATASDELTWRPSVLGRGLCRLPVRARALAEKRIP
jgi:cytochrome P450